jgi:hypothetical protein
MSISSLLFRGTAEEYLGYGNLSISLALFMCINRKSFTKFCLHCDHIKEDERAQNLEERACPVDIRIDVRIILRVDFKEIWH